MRHEPGAEYDGPAYLLETGAEIEVQLRGHFEPIDGRFHWYGRFAADNTLEANNLPGETITVRTPHGEATGRLSDPDPWRRLRITGTGKPPF